MPLTITFGIHSLLQAQKSDSGRENVEEETTVGSHGIYADYFLHEPSPHHVPGGAKILLIQVYETCLPDPSQQVRGWLIVWESGARGDVYERIGVIKLRLEHEYIAVLNTLFEESG